jgi:hypothetical protein
MELSNFSSLQAEPGVYLNKLCSSGLPLTIDSLGGWQLVKKYAKELSTSPLLADVFDAIFNSLPDLKDNEQLIAFELVLFLIKDASHDIAYTDSLEIIIANDFLFDADYSRALTDIFAEKALDPKFPQNLPYKKMWWSKNL